MDTDTRCALAEGLAAGVASVAASSVGAACAKSTATENTSWAGSKSTRMPIGPSLPAVKR